MGVVDPVAEDFRTRPYWKASGSPRRSAHRTSSRLFTKRELPSRVAATLGTDYPGYRLVEGMVRSYGPGPFYVRVARDEALLLHNPDDIKFVLNGSPDPFASDLEPKRKGMAAFQPDALTISRGEIWADRRKFAEYVLIRPSRCTAWRRRS